MDYILNRVQSFLLNNPRTLAFLFSFVAAFAAILSLVATSISSSVNCPPTNEYHTTANIPSTAANTHLSNTKPTWRTGNF